MCGYNALPASSASETSQATPWLTPFFVKVIQAFTPLKSRQAPITSSYAIKIKSDVSKCLIENEVELYFMREYYKLSYLY